MSQDEWDNKVFKFIDDFVQAIPLMGFIAFMITFGFWIFEEAIKWKFQRRLEKESYKGDYSYFQMHQKIPGAEYVVNQNPIPYYQVQILPALFVLYAKMEC